MVAAPGSGRAGTPCVREQPSNATLERASHARSAPRATDDGLTDVPWFGAMGNHDLGDSDIYATCPEKGSRVVIDGQHYGSNQLDADKGGYRTGGNDNNYHVSRLIAIDCHQLPSIAMDCHGLPWIAMDCH